MGYNVEEKGQELFSLLERQEQMVCGVRDLEPELAMMIKVFTGDVVGLCAGVNTLLVELGEQVKKVTEVILSGEDDYTVERVTSVVERVEKVVSRHFLRLNYFQSYLLQVKSLLLAELLRVPNDYKELCRVVSGTSVIKTTLKEVKDFIEFDLQNLKKELV
jgi:hypothetical protein